MESGIQTVKRYAREEAGTRCESLTWMAAEVVATSTWFVVECDQQVAGQPATKRWVTTSIHIADLLLTGRPSSTWSKVLICMHQPTSDTDSTVFDEVSSAYQSEANDLFLFQLANGKSFITSANDSPPATEKVQELRLVYKSHHK